MKRVSLVCRETLFWFWLGFYRMVRNNLDGNEKFGEKGTTLWKRTK